MVGWEFGTVWMRDTGVPGGDGRQREGRPACCFSNETFCQALGLDLWFRGPEFPLIHKQLSDVVKISSSSVVSDPNQR